MDVSQSIVDLHASIPMSPIVDDVTMVVLRVAMSPNQIGPMSRPLVRYPWKIHRMVITMTNILGG